jgi:TamB, inner membrane protein subunit of TAM complex
MRIIKLFLKIFSLLAVLAIIGVSWVFSPFGQEHIAGLIAKQINQNSNYNISLNNVSFRFPLILRIKRIDVRDEHNKWMIIHDLKISVIPSFNLIRHQIIFDEIRVKTLEFIKTPIMAKTVKPAKSINYDIAINKFIVEEFIILDRGDKAIHVHGSLDWRRMNRLLDFNGIVGMESNKLGIKGKYSLEQNLLTLGEILLTSEPANLEGSANIDLNNYNTKAFFNLKTYDIDTNIDIAITDGKLLLDAKDILSAGLTFTRDGGLLQFNKIRIESNFKDLVTGRLEFDLSKKYVDGNLKILAKNLNKLHRTLQGSYDATINFKHSQDKQLFDLSLKAMNLPSQEFKAASLLLSGFWSQDYNNRYLLNLNQLQLAAGKYTLKNTKPITVQGNRDNIIFDLTKINFNNSYLNFNGKILKDEIEADLVLNSTDLSNVAGLILPDVHRLQAIINGKLHISGKIKDPKVNGSININKGNYKHLELGVSLKDIIAGLVVQDNQIFTDKCQFSDVKNNIARCSFKLDLSNRDKDFAAHINANNFYLFLSQIGTQGSISGDLILMGNKDFAKLSGNINVNSAEIRIPERFGPTIYELNFIEKVKEVKSSSISPYFYFLDVNIIANNKVFVRGWGLDIELKGALKLVKSKGDFAVNGKLSTIRGRYQEFGKYFDIAKGDLIFEGPVPPSPHLNIIGTTAIDHNQINLELTGPLLSPHLSIYSNPHLAQEEALSLILFGKKSDNISAFQAISLASSLKKLSGHGDNNLEILGTARKILHVDEISVTQDDATGSTKLGIGKYISNKIYFKVEKAVESGGASTSVEYEVRPNISIEGSVGEEGDGSVGINWKRDF